MGEYRVGKNEPGRERRPERPLAWETLRRYEPLMRKWIRTLHIYREQEDALQTARLACLEALEKFDPQKGDLSAYVQAYVKGRLLNWLSQERKWHERHCFPQTDEEGADWPERIASDETRTSEESLVIEEWLKTLSEKEKICVTEHLLKGKKIVEVAAEYGVSTAAVKDWKKRAKRKLRCYLSRHR
ncbi:hypothetical protein BSNK01_13080 [Bacillaceae bacterium]